MEFDINAPCQITGYEFNILSARCYFSSRGLCYLRLTLDQHMIKTDKVDSWENLTNAIKTVFSQLGFSHNAVDAIQTLNQYSTAGYYPRNDEYNFEYLTILCDEAFYRECDPYYRWVMN